MKKTIFLILFFATFTSVWAQKQKVHVYLKNGSVINGKLLEPLSPESIKVESNNTTWVFQRSEVDTILAGKPKKHFNSIEIPYFFLILNMVCWLATIPQKKIAQFPNIDAFDVIPFQDYLFMIGDNGFYQYDYSNIQNIKEVSFIPVKNKN